MLLNIDGESIKGIHLIPLMTEDGENQESYSRNVHYFIPVYWYLSQEKLASVITVICGTNYLGYSQLEVISDWLACLSQYNHRKLLKSQESEASRSECVSKMCM